MFKNSFKEYVKKKHKHARKKIQNMRNYLMPEIYCVKICLRERVSRLEESLKNLDWQN